MNMSQAKQLPDLNLSQNGLSADLSDGENRTQPWYVHEAFYAGVLVYEGSHQFISHQGQHPVATVNVILPTVMVGGAEEIRDDVRAAVARHAAKHLGE